VFSQCLESPDQRYMVADRRYKYMYWEENGVEELYDQVEDPNELHNLTGIKTNITQKMRAALTEWCAANGDAHMLSNGALKATPNTNTTEWKPNPGVFGRRWY